MKNINCMNNLPKRADRFGFSDEDGEEGGDEGEEESSFSAFIFFKC